MATTKAAVFTLLSAVLLQSVSMEMIEVNFTMQENNTVTYRVGSLLDAVRPYIDFTEGQRLRFSFIAQGTQTAVQTFTLNESTGNLFTQVMIDRDNRPECQFRVECIISFKVGLEILDTLEFREIHVKVMVEDINDNHPEFSSPVLTLSVMEDVAVNTTFLIENAIDYDYGGTNGIQEYYLATPSSKFGFSSVREDERTFDLKLFVKEKLDREDQASYTLKIVARDGGNPVLSGTLTVSVMIQDKNDNSPQFVQNIYNKTVKEDIEPGTVILNVSATDRDDAENGRVSYRIKKTQADYATISQHFAMDTTKGSLSVLSELVYRQGLFYEFIVEALDNGQPPRESEAKVLLYIEDAGNNAPTIAFSTITPGSTVPIDVMENSSNGTFVVHLTVEDTDSGQNGEVSCSVSNPAFDIKRTSSTGYRVVVNSLLDRETLGHYNISVICSDQGSPRLSSSVYFLVNVLDQNDNAPVFQFGNSYSASVFENAVQEEIVLQVSAYDKDLPDKGPVWYNIIGEDKISIHAETGVISVKPSFDRETTPFYEFEVLAIDRGTPPMTGTTTVTLEIKDLNDNSPQFLHTPYEFTIFENSKSGTSIDRLYGKDDDKGDNAKFTFSMSPVSMSISVPFVVFSNGVIKSNQELDREKQHHYEFWVMVTDQGTPVRNSITLVTVTVLDVNDNAPVIGFPTEGNRTVSILYPDASVTHVTKVNAHDIDSGENSVLQYSIKEGDENGMFSIDQDTGEISVNQVVNIDADMKVILQLLVEDRGTPAMSSEETLIVEVVYSNGTLAATEGTDTKLIMISVVVVVVTILISAAIIAVIFFLRYVDAKRRHVEDRSRSDSDCGFDDKPTLYVVSPPEKQDDPQLVTEVARKKKEVSFSLDEIDSLNNYSRIQRDSNQTPPVSTMNYNTGKISPVRDHDRYSDSKTSTLLESLKLQQLIMETRTKQNQAHGIHPEDSRSETSGETTTSDSGRGGSEEDVPSTSPSSDEHHTFELLSSPHKNGGLQKQFLSHNLSMSSSRKDNSSPLPPPIPTRTYKSRSSFNDFKNMYPDYVPRPYASEMVHEAPQVDIASLSWEHHYPTNQPAVDFSDINTFPPQFRGSLKSRDDDDCSTTTSGSYTIYSEEML